MSTSTMTRTVPARRVLDIGAAAGAAAAAALAVIMLFLSTSGGGAFRYAGDWLTTADGLPYMLAALAVMTAVHALQKGADGRVGRAGLLVNAAGLAGLLVTMVVSLSAGAERSVGPLYPIATLATFAGTVLFAIGAFRARVLPRWLPPVWAVAWIVGGPVSLKGTSLLLAAVYVALAAATPRR